MVLIWRCRLDVGEGREINLEGKCSRSKLLSQCIKYLGPVSIQYSDRTQRSTEQTEKKTVRWLMYHGYICAERKRGL